MPLDLNESPIRSEESKSSDNSKNDGSKRDFGIGRALQVGNTFENLDEVYDLYCEYGRLMGFGVKKASQAYFKGSLDVRMKVYLCSNEGRSDEKRSSDKTPVYWKQMNRTQCKARLRVCRESMDVLWTVTVFNTTHNHELLPQSQGYLMRSARRLTEGKCSLVEALVGAGIGVSRAHRFMCKEAGGVQNVGFIKKDVYAHLDKLHMEQRQPDGDANALVQLFLDRSNKENDFYSNVDTDDEGRIVNFFFRDSRCKIDYTWFGDVLFVDTTYKTNKYDLYCVPFTGINHHRSNVMFGMGFLSQETTASFEWLFTKFLESMNGKEPQVIFTDQCQAMMNGVDYSFHTASHRLCQWHINRNTVNHFGNLIHNSDFKSKWERCMNFCETEGEFDEIWRAMINNYVPPDNRGWFNNMYKLRKRWASVFTHNKFTGGSHTTSRSESTNRAFKELCSRTITLFELVIQYEFMLKGWREIEGAQDAANRGIPGGMFGTNRLLRQISQRYTRCVFRLFETEAINCLDVDITKFPHDFQAPLLEYNITYSGSSKRIRTVIFNRHTNYASCSCHMWETNGIVCRHILKVYFYSMVNMVPDELILRRWTKEAKNRITKDHLGFDEPVGRPDFVRIMGFGNRSMRLLYDLIDHCRNHNCEDIIDDGLAEMKEKVCARMMKQVKAAESHGTSSKSITRDPKIKKPTGPKRTRSYWDSPKKKRGPKTTCTQTPKSKSRLSMSPSISKPNYNEPSPSHSQYDDGTSCQQ